MLIYDKRIIITYKTLHGTLGLRESTSRKTNLEDLSVLKERVQTLLDKVLFSLLSSGEIPWFVQGQICQTMSIQCAVGAYHQQWVLGHTEMVRTYLVPNHTFWACKWNSSRMRICGSQKGHTELWESGCLCQQKVFGPLISLSKALKKLLSEQAETTRSL